MYTCKQSIYQSCTALQLSRLKLIAEPAYATLSPVSCKLTMRVGCVTSNGTWAGRAINLRESLNALPTLLSIYPYGYAVTCDVRL